MTTPHILFQGGPECPPECPGPETPWHNIYVAGWKAAEESLAAAVRSVLPLPPMPDVPAWVWGPTRKKWTRTGIEVALARLGFASRWH